MTDESTESAEDHRTDNDEQKGTDLTITEFSKLVRDHQNAYIRVADSKSSILLSGLVAYFGLSLSVIGTNLGNGGVPFLIAVGISVFSALVGIYFAARAVYPSTPATTQGLVMWESIVEQSKDDYRKKMESKTSDELLEELIDENYQLAKVNDKKYRQVRLALLAAVPTVLFGIFAMLVLIVY